MILQAGFGPLFFCFAIQPSSFLAPKSLNVLFYETRVFSFKEIRQAVLKSDIPARDGNPISPVDIQSRKKDHIELALGQNVEYERTTTGFEDYGFEHNAFPELNFEDVDTKSSFLGKQLSFPLIITGMTGGYKEAQRINIELAEVCEEQAIAIGSGSQRQALESDEFIASYSVLRKYAPSVPVIGNIGAAEVALMKDSSAAQKLVDMLEADAFAVHTNPLQEFIQPEGNAQFKGVLAGIEMLVKSLSVPVLVKEVGAGISAASARKLFDVGVRYVDVAGAGGTTWAGLEMLRRKDRIAVSPSFREWGIPTATALIEVCREMPEDAHIIASGGISDGVTIAKAIALGAELAGAARPLLRTLELAGQQALIHMIKGWKNDFQGVLFLTGAQNLEEFRSVPIIRQFH
jgi:isopentenyl-diphosphate Delta-isomerase